MKKNEVQHQHSSQPTAVQQNKGVALEAPQGESLAQLEAAVESSPQVAKSAQLAAAADASPTVTAQRRMADLIRNSPAMTAQRKWVESVGNSPSSTAQAKFANDVANAPRLTAQRQQLNSLAAPTPQHATEEPSSQTAQRAEAPAKPNHTGLPDNLKSGIESLSGLSMDNVKVHYNSSQPAQLNALAYAQGSDIHVAPGQEKHLPHEAWHVVQQAQGRVKPTMQAKGTAINDDAGLETEADLMGGRAVSVGVVQGKSMESDPIDSVQGKSIDPIHQGLEAETAVTVKGMLHSGGAGANVAGSASSPVIQRVLKIAGEPKSESDVDAQSLNASAEVIAALKRQAREPEGFEPYDYGSWEEAVKTAEDAGFASLGKSSSDKEERDGESKEKSKAGSATIVASTSFRSTASATARERTTSRIGKRRSWCGEKIFEKRLIEEVGTVMLESIKDVFDEIQDFGKYEMKGMQSASTQAEGTRYKTTDKMHSEMVALNAQIRKGTYQVSNIVSSSTGFNFTTTAPHCGHCTFFLQALGLPLTRPTKGRHGSSSDLTYPLPDKIKNNPGFISRILKCDHTSLLLMAASNPAKGVGTWKEFVKRGYLDCFWNVFLWYLDGYLKSEFGSSSSSSSATSSESMGSDPNDFKMQSSQPLSLPPSSSSFHSTPLAPSPSPLQSVPPSSSLSFGMSLDLSRVSMGSHFLPQPASSMSSMSTSPNPSSPDSEGSNGVTV